MARRLQNPYLRYVTLPHHRPGERKTRQAGQYNRQGHGKCKEADTRRARVTYIRIEIDRYNSSTRECPSNARTC